MYVDAVFCGEVVYTAGADKFTVECNNAVGSVVKLVQNDNYLTLCEVEVFGELPKLGATSNPSLFFQKCIVHNLLMTYPIR